MGMKQQDAGNPNWHIEAWSVRDGMAFASRRPAGQVLSAQRTVFVGVPGLEAVPVGSVSPALWATRANFQQGLHDPDGEEIGFENLDQVRELVRRGYLAGGIGPSPPEGEPGPPPARPPNAREGEQAEADLQRKLADLAGEYQHHDMANPASRQRFFELLTRPQHARLLRELLLDCAVSVIVLWAQRSVAGGPSLRDRSDFSRWISAVIWHLGLWTHPWEAERSVEESLRINGGEGAAFHDLFYGWRYGTDWHASAAGDLVFVAPCPTPRGGGPRVSCLSDKVLHYVLSASASQRTQALEDLVPAVLAAMLVTVTMPVPVLRNSDADFIERLRAALAWLSAQMPQHALSARVDAALQRFVAQQLRRAA